MLGMPLGFSIGAGRGLFRDDRVSGRSGGKAGPNVGIGRLLREDASDGWRLLDAVIVFR